MPDHPLFATCTYQEFKPDYGIPVKSTLGHPRFKLAYPLTHRLDAAAPDRSFFKAEKPEFRERYFAKLDATGVEGFRTIAATIRALEGTDATLVLLCFDKLWEPETWCHRTMFGEWWQDRTGLEVPEYGRTRWHSARQVTMNTTAHGTLFAGN